MGSRRDGGYVSAYVVRPVTRPVSADYLVVAGGAGEAASRAAGWDVRAGRWERVGAGRRPRGGCDAP